jgi:hypothetical protein
MIKCTRCTLLSLIKIRCVLFLFFFGDTPTSNNIQFGVMSCNLSWLIFSYFQLTNQRQAYQIFRYQNRVYVVWLVNIFNYLAYDGMVKMFHLMSWKQFFITKHWNTEKAILILSCVNPPNCYNSFHIRTKIW